MNKNGDSTMNDEQEKKGNDNSNEANGDQAYQTLVDWVKTVPDAIKDIKKNGTEEDLQKYMQQVKMVVDKLKEIEKKLSS